MKESLIIKDIEDSIAEHQDYLDVYVDKFGSKNPVACTELGVIAGLKEALNWIRMEIGDEK